MFINQVNSLIIIIVIRLIRLPLYYHLCTYHFVIIFTNTITIICQPASIYYSTAVVCYSITIVIIINIIIQVIIVIIVMIVFGSYHYCFGYCCYYYFF